MTIGSRPAEQASAADQGGAPKGVARQGVLSALPRSGRFAGDAQSRSLEDPTPERPGIRIYAAPVYRSHYDGARWSKRYADTPTAAYACRCGQTRTGTGQRSVAALVAEYNQHRETCPLLTSASEGREAA
ncbi:hypothetical protein [Streptomyces katrae]|uniref:hypothetical protein n=1 Tax=Streptomyces katrae TaxID=68223 RepID=UPI000B1B28F8|nr:hypothetical protein [Streptomyces katrae]